jgi:hypothetical protein
MFGSLTATYRGGELIDQGAVARPVTLTAMATLTATATLTVTLTAIVTHYHGDAQNIMATATHTTTVTLTATTVCSAVRLP